MTTYYASPGDNLTTKVGTLLPGDTLLLNDGTYTQSGAPIIDFTGIGGSSGAHITVSAVNDGKVNFDGQGQASVFNVYFDNCSYIDVHGIASYNGNEPWRITNVKGLSAFISLYRCTGHDAVGRFHIFDATGGSGGRINNILMEDCAGWGQGRYVFVAYHADTITFRRCWADWGFTSSGAGQGPYATCATYGSTSVTWENFIGQNCYPKSPTLSDTSPYTGAIMTSDSGADTGTQFFGCLWFNNTNGYEQQENTGADANTLLRHCVILNSKLIGTGTTTQESHDGIIDSFNSPVVMTYDHLSIDTTTNLGVRKYSTCASNFTNCIFSHMTGSGAVSSTTDVTTANTDFFANSSNSVTLSGSDQTVDPAYDTATYGAIGGILKGPTAASLLGAGSDGTDFGAKILYQYIDGVLTTTPLWPWPMDARIQAEHGVTPTTQIWTTTNGLYPAAPSAPVTETPSFPHHRFGHIHGGQ